MGQRDADEALQAAAQRAALDPLRPGFHFTAPACWMNDPNGPIFHAGRYHLFYQLNPFEDRWGHIHWGHADSEDLVHWRDRPIALHPQLEAEAHCFSGCTVALGEQVVALYTSIGPARPFADGAVQCRAVALDPELDTWARSPVPVLTEAAHAPLKIYEWRDPYPVRIGDVWYLVLGGSLAPGRAGQGVVALYRATDAHLARFEFVKILYRHPDDREAPNLECPNFFPLGNRWVLLFSPHGPPLWVVGDFDTLQLEFTPLRQGRLDLGDGAHCSAPTTFRTPGRRTVLFGWVGGFERRADWPLPAEGRGWNGCLTLPRTLAVGPDDQLVQQPVREVERLRRERLAQGAIEGLPAALEFGSAAQLELTLEGGLAETGFLEVRLAALTVRREHGRLTIRSGAETLADAPLPGAGEPAPLLRIFFDHSVLELFAGGLTFCRVTPPGELDSVLMLAASEATGLWTVWKVAAQRLSASDGPAT